MEPSKPGNRRRACKFHNNSMMRRLFLATLYVYAIVSTSCCALAPMNPYGWDEKQPDGSAAGKLFLKGHPFNDESGVYMVDQHGHPVVMDDKGWYVYASVNENSNKTSSLRGGAPGQERRQGLVPFHPTEHVISPDSKPPRHLVEQVTSLNFPKILEQNASTHFLCQGQERSPWCPNNQKLLGRNALPPKTRGTTKTLVLLIRFSDHEDRDLPSREDFEFLFNGKGTNDDRAPTGTMQDFFATQSLNSFTIEAHVEDWITAPFDEEHYSFGNYGLVNYFAQCAYGALDQMDKRGEDWSRFDQDGDGTLDSVVILHSGFVAEGGGTDCYNNKPQGVHRIWSHATSVPDNQDAWYSADDSVRISSYCTTSALFGTCEANLQRVGVIGHEMLHTLGLPDMLGKPGTGVGIFDVMGMMWGPDGSLYYPSTLSPWCRQQLGWISPTRITTSGEYKITTAQYSGDAYRIDLAQDEYLLIENRQKKLMDVILPGEGLLIWHIDDNMGSAWMNKPGWPLQDGWPGNNNHYSIALLSPDGQYDMEKENNYGDETDYWTSGMALEPGPGVQEAQSSQLDMYPNTDTYSQGIIKRTGIRIYDISANGDTMTFRVDVPGVPEAFMEEETDEPTRSPTPNPTDSPTRSSTPNPTDSPTRSPTPNPTDSPTRSPTPNPTDSPTVSPTSNWPTPSPTESRQPTTSPTRSPTSSPTESPTREPSASPTTSPMPSKSPTTSPAPTKSPTTSPTKSPTISPTVSPSESPSASPSSQPVGPYDYEGGGQVIKRPFAYYGDENDYR